MAGPGSSQADLPRNDKDLAELCTISPEEAVHAQARLDSVGIEYAAQGAPHEFGLNVGDFGTVRIFVPAPQLAAAREALRLRDLPSPAVGEKPGGQGITQLRLERRYHITRLAIVPVGLMNIVVGAMLLSSPGDLGWIPILLGVAYLGFDYWSIAQPEKAFGVILLVSLASVVWSFVVRIPLGISGAIVLLMILYAYEGSVKAAKARAREDAAPR